MSKINIHPPAEMIRAYREANGVGLQQAHRTLQRHLMMEQIEKAETVDDLKEVLVALMDRT